MVNLSLKLLLGPGVIFVADVISPAINYSNGWQIIFTGLLIGTIGYIMDAMLLINVGAGASAVMDTIAAAIVVYFSQFFALGSSITFFGAMLGGGLLGVSEYLTHRLILGDGYKEEKKSTS